LAAIKNSTIKMFKKRLITALSLLVTITSVGQQTKDTLELPPGAPPKQQADKNNSGEIKTWKNDEYGIKFLIPTDWKTITPNEGEVVSFASSKKEIFAIRAYKGVFPGTADEIKQRLETAFKGQFPKMKIISSKVTTIGELETADIILSGTIGTSSGLYRGISFHNGTNSFIITCLYSQAQAKQYSATIKSILSSMTFN
jgi:hypothetical protein